MPDVLHIRTRPFVEKNPAEQVWYAADVVPVPFTIPAHITAYLLTSQNAVVRLVQEDAPKHPVYAVGQATAKVAQAAGFPLALVGDGNAQRLAEKILQQQLPAQTFCHVRGDMAAVDFHADLVSAGHQVVDQVGYRVVPVAAIPEAFYQAAVCVVYAASLSQQVCQQCLLGDLTGKTWVCWSQAVAQPLLEKGVPAGQIKILHKPSAQVLETVLSCLHG